MLLVCPICLENGDKIVLGSIDHNGHLHVQKFKGDGGTVVIVAEKQLIAHYCGFGTTIVGKKDYTYTYTLQK